jgi:hypothetical protein
MNGILQIMIDSKTLDDLTRKLSNLLPADLDVLKQDLEKNIRAILQSTFQKLDLVTREEFDVQTEVLNRTREKIEALEKKLAELEKNQFAARPLSKK